VELGWIGEINSELWGRQPPKLDETQQAQLIERLREGQLWTFLPVGSPHLNPIEPVWKSLKWESSPLIVEGEDEHRVPLTDLLDQLTEKLSFTGSWTDNHLDGFLSKWGR